MITPPPPLNVTAWFPELIGREKVTVRLHPEVAEDPGTAASKMGGPFLWPLDEPWPTCPLPETLPEEVVLQRLMDFGPDGTASINMADSVDTSDDLHNDYLVGVVQLNAEDVPELAFYPDTDLFQLLWCPRNHPDEYAPYCEIYWRKAAQVTNPRAGNPIPRYPDMNMSPTTCVFRPECVVEYPDILELPLDLQERILRWEATPEAGAYSYQYQLSVAPGTKVGGYVAWNQTPHQPSCPSCCAEMEHLLTIASGEGSATAGANERWYPGMNLSEQSHILIGDGAQLTIFICRTCPDWPIAWVHQA